MKYEVGEKSLVTESVCKAHDSLLLRALPWPMGCDHDIVDDLQSGAIEWDVLFCFSFEEESVMTARTNGLQIDLT